MYINFARKLFEALVKDEFSYIRRTDDRLVYETEALSLYKDKGSILYIVTIIDAQKMSRESYDELIKRYSAVSEGADRARIILMNVLVDDKEGLLAFDEDYMPDKRSYVFSYNVDLESGNVSAPEEQPELLDMKSRILEAVEAPGEGYVHGTDLENLERELSEKYALPGKSDNITLTLLMILLNAFVWLLLTVSGGSYDTWTLVAFGALSRNLIINLHEYYRFFTAMFLHIGLAHLVNNALALYIFGGRVERYFGKFRFILIYIISGLIGNVVTIFFVSGISAGASGAIFGLLGALMSVTYRTGRSVGGLSPYVVLLLCVSSIGMGFINPVVNNFAHVAGFITGLILGRISYSTRNV